VLNLPFEINLHEGVQLLGSSLAALAVIACGLVTPSRWPRFWSAALVTVVSVALTPAFGSLYALGKFGLLGALVGGIVAALTSSDAARRLMLDRGARRSTHRTTIVGLVVGVAIGWMSGLVGLASLSPEVQTVAVNAVLLGVPVWLLGRWLTRGSKSGTEAHCGPEDSQQSQPPLVAEDLSFLYGFVVLALAAILLPEARAVLYYGFMKVDFQHSRLSVAMTLPMAAISVVFLNRFLPGRSTPTTIRWVTSGLALGLALWIGREAVAATVVAQVGPTLAIQPERLLTIEMVRVLTSLVLLVAAAMSLARRAPAPCPSMAGGVLATWMVLETFGLADHRLNGPTATAQDRPFAFRDYMQVPGGQMRVPSLAERAAVQERLEADRYRAVLVEDRATFPTHADPHLAAFWGLRLVEGYSTGAPRRFGWLPLNIDAASAHHVDFADAEGEQIRDNIPWELLAVLNVKYVVTVDRSFWFNPSPGGQVPPFDVSQLEVIENPNPVTPRAFFTARVTPARQPPRLAGDDGRRPAPRDPPIEQPVRHTVVEGIPASRRFSTEGTIDAKFDGDRVHVRVEPFGEDRFLVLNEIYHPLWRATVNGVPAPIYPTNLVMRGILVPAGTTTIELSYDPFVFTPPGYAIMALGVLLIGLLTWGLTRIDLVPRGPFLVWRRG
jgi:hypothetical protein